MNSQAHETIVGALVSDFLQRHSSQAAHRLNEMEPEEAADVLLEQPVSIASRLLSRMNPDRAREAARQFDDASFRRIVGGMETYHCSTLLSRFGDRKAIDHYLALLPERLSREVGDLLKYPRDTAGGLMDPNVTTARPGDTVDEVIARVRLYPGRHVIDICVIDEEQVLIGLASLQEVATSPSGTQMGSIMHKNPVSIRDVAAEEDLLLVFQSSRIAGLPVVDADGHLLGIIRYSALVDASVEDASEDVQTMFGAGREERATSPVLFSVLQRLPWLQVNLVTAFLAAAVVGAFEETIAKVTALAIFLPVVAGQSGNTGAQALAVTMRGLLLREVRASQWMFLARREMLVGFVNGVAIALTTSIIAYVWMDSMGIAMVIGTAMVFSMVVAGFAGALIPSVLKAFGQDPAQSSSIILTTVTDIVGFMSFLGLAQLMLRFL